jgi:uncharacterized membrane protein YjgN (DUF898 family)
VNQMSWPPQVPPPPPPSSVPPPMPVAFSGKRSEFFHLVRRGAGLEFVTLGFYRFWLLTDMRRHLWANTLVDGDAAEYTGRGRELLIGFLVALAILVPIYLGYFLIGLEAERFQAFASIPLIAFFYMFGQFAIYRARRYRLTRTVWRGVRFWMKGSGWIYALQASLWGVLTALTLGLALPWRTAALERYKMRHSYYGNLQGSFEGRGWEFFKRGWWLWLLAPIAIYVSPLAPFVYGAFKAVEWRWWLSVMLVASMSGAPFVEFFKSQDFMKSIPLLVLAGLGYLAFALAMNIVIRVYLVRDLWVRVLGSVNISGIEAAANVAAQGDMANALGEGFADGLDVGGF